ncbi:RB-associated KRAB zinc finger protein-like [Solea solea]|uniref:RB-associated KRAB zinc finger protein-like n=1 Tax=Solea solea TaxID=90069 RepID=UPI002729B2E4|nr:RB-associated KRAB zinc finger protein-like [Solea solea]
MSAPLLLRAFVKERLSAAAEEIFQFFERTIETYEEDATSSKQEIERLTRLLQEFSNQRVLSQASTCKEETEQELSLTHYHRDPDDQAIKEEDQEVWVSQHGEQAEEFQDVNHSYQPHSVVYETREQEEDTKPSLLPQTQNSESEKQFGDSQETKTVLIVLPFASFQPSQSPMQNKMVQDGPENDEPTASFMSNQTKSEQDQSTIIISKESSESSHLNSLPPGHHCLLCHQSFSSKHYLINHALRMHSKDEGFVCAVCGKASESTESLNMHLKSHVSLRCCHVCGKYCNSANALAEHMTSHTGVKLHRCHVCGKECARKGDLKIHMRIHTGERPYCCSLCNKTFTHSGHLKKHFRSHMEDRPHRCDVCGKGYLQIAHLKYHLSTHAQN